MTRANSRKTTQKPRPAKLAAARFDEIEIQCEQRGLRLTEMRREAYLLLAEKKAPLSAYDLLEGLEARVGRKLAPPTVYRALDFLLEQGFIHRIASSSKYLTCDHPGEAHESIYFMCSSCGTAREIEDTRIAKLLSEDASGVGFSPQRHVVEVQGVCKDCGTA